MRLQKSGLALKEVALDMASLKHQISLSRMVLVYQRIA